MHDLRVPPEGEEFGPVFASHTFAMPFARPVTTREPSGPNVAESTSLECP